MTDPQYFSTLKQYMSDKNAKVSGYSYESSKIVGPEGKTVEVTKTSKLDPSGHIDTKVKECFKDEKGQKTEKDWSTQHSLMSEEKRKEIQQ
mmetsp:Transcript_41877/g.48555  ORF Transcript_41877/g.48555 Transcript_41877/m.48555 type:complete len:91 (+) Transcript_41877:480-752(+)